MNEFIFSHSLIEWYRENKRDLPWRNTIDPYAIWVSEIMLQQTRVEAVKPYYKRFMSELPNIESLARADEELLYKLWQGLGYYSRVRNMQKAAQTCVLAYGGQLPESYDELKKLCGIGAYTAGAIASFAYGLPVPAVDGNVLRVLSRYLGIEKPINTPAVLNEICEFIKNTIPKEQAGEFNQGLIELGATLCGPDKAPRCGGCPLVHSCVAFRDRKTDILPVRPPKKEKRKEKYTLLILKLGDTVALEKRPPKGLLGGLWQPPTLKGTIDLEGVREYLQEQSAEIAEIRALPSSEHIFTHIVWEMQAYEISLRTPGNFTFYGKEERDQLALPSAFKAYKNLLS